MCTRYLLTYCDVLTHLSVGGEPVSHSQLVSIIPYSSVPTSSESDDKITAHCDPRRPRPVAIGDKVLSAADRQDVIRTLVSYLDQLEPDNRQRLMSSDNYQSSPGRTLPSRVVRMTTCHSVVVVVA